MKKWNTKKTDLLHDTINRLSKLIAKNRFEISDKNGVYAAVRKLSLNYSVKVKFIWT